MALNLLTRAGPLSDFVTDVSLRREGTDPQTGRRYPEELAFVVVSEQDPQHLTACLDPDRLGRWLDAALSVPSVDEILELP